MSCVFIIQIKVLHTQNIFSSCLENFVEALNVKNSPKSVEYSETKFAFRVEIIFNPKLFFMLQYKMIDELYGSDSKCAVFPQSRR